MSCFQFVNAIYQAFPLAECSEENPVPYSAGTETTESRTARRTVRATEAIQRSPPCQISGPPHR